MWKCVVVFIEKKYLLSFSPHQSCLFKILSILYYFLPQELHCCHIPPPLHRDYRWAQVEGSSINFLPSYMLMTWCEIACSNFLSVNLIPFYGCLCWFHILKAKFLCLLYVLDSILKVVSYPIIRCMKNHGSTMRLGTIQLFQNNWIWFCSYFNI
jgi:hypothetical protein